jgi:ankyrin repeat protein
VEHAEFEDVSSYIGGGMDLLFDMDKPHFATWVSVFDIDFNGYSYEGKTRSEGLDRVPLYYAALCDFRGLVERLLTAHPQGLDVDGGYYGAPLNAALAKGHLDIAQFLLDHGAVGDNIGFHDQTGLCIASTHGYADVVRSLIDRGANLNGRCKDYNMDFGGVWWTPLQAAIYNDHPDIVLLLLEGGADPETRGRKKQTALFIASSCGHADVVRSLIDHGADLNAKSLFRRDGPHGGQVEWTPLHVAIDKKRRDIVLVLLEHGADMENRSSQDETALYLASSRGCVDIVRQLISHGADPNAECRTYTPMHQRVMMWTPLHVASYHGSPEIARVLLEHGVNPNALDHSVGIALHLASKITVIKLLLEYGANMDARDKEGWTRLHWAAFGLNLQVLVVLLDRGADPHAQTNKGETPIQLAISWRSQGDQAEIIRLLSERMGERNVGSTIMGLTWEGVL